MYRRTLLAGAGIGGTALLAGCSDPIRGSTDHLVQIVNLRETAHDVFVETDFEGETSEYGPKTIEPNGNWKVRRVESRGELTVRVHVDDTLIWDDTHEIPTPSGDRRSFAQVELLPDDVRTGVMQEAS